MAGGPTKSTRETTVICAVWSGDKNRHALLQAHAKCLDAQSKPVERIYVFDAGDQPPPDLPGTAITVSEPLAIYAAWNVALSLVQTPYVMNLNLDDRLASDGAEKLAAAAAEKSADLVCGDWRICYSQEDTDTLRASEPLTALPFVRGWPMAKGALARLGSAGERDTFGPGCLWRMSLHRELPRYPWRFNDRTPVMSCGDWLFWRELQKRKKHILRVQEIIGS